MTTLINIEIICEQLETEFIAQYAENWKPTVTNIIEPAVYDEISGELISPAVTKEVPNPRTAEMVVYDFTLDSVLRKFVEAREKQIKTESAISANQQIAAIKDSLKPSIAINIKKAEE